MVLPLTSPVGSDFIKDFPSLNTVDLDLIDAYAGPCLTTHALQAWTPQLTAVTTNPTLGTAGFIRGYYYKIFDQVYTWGEFRFGTAGINAGSGIYIMSLPFPAKSLVGFFTSTIGDAPVVGHGNREDASAANERWPLSVHLRSATTLMFGFKMDSGSGSREVGSGAPIVWAINDGITWSAKYQREP